MKEVYLHAQIKNHGTDDHSLSAHLMQYGVR